MSAEGVLTSRARAPFSDRRVAATGQGTGTVSDGVVFALEG